MTYYPKNTMLKSFTMACLLSIASAVNMKYYDPQTGVEPAFLGYLQELYNQTEIPSTTTSFTDFFYPPGTLIITTRTAVGAEAIIQLKQEIVPTDGSIQLNHFPNITSVMSENSTDKVYYAQGVINTAIQGGNCSAAYYRTQFTIRKESDGTVDLTPHSGNLVIYNDFFLDPPMPPSSIPCET